MPRQWQHLAGVFRRQTAVSQATVSSISPISATQEQAVVVRRPIQTRKQFALPSRVPSWFVGHMYRAMRSLPTLLERKPPPLIIEVRDARLPISSINPAFEQVLKQMAKKEKQQFPDRAVGRNLDREWRDRRLIVYNKSDLIDSRLIDPIIKSFDSLQGEEVMFVNSARDRDVSRVIKWVKARARLVAQYKGGEEKSVIEEGRVPKTEKKSAGAEASTLRKPPSHLTGAFRHTTTPDDGVRLVIVGMPNVGKSSLLNALRRVGTGKGKAASTSPEPGHTRKLTGTVRINRRAKDMDSPQSTGKAAAPSPVFLLNEDSFYPVVDTSLPAEAVPTAPAEPDIYVYDTPGVMVPFLGRGESGAETALKIMVTAGMKTTWFDIMALADYLLFRMNRRWTWKWKLWEAQGQRGEAPRPEYLKHLPLPAQAEPTDDISILLEQLALKAPGTLMKGGERNLERAAQFMITQWREGKMGANELDLGAFEDPTPVPGLSHTFPSTTSSSSSSDELYQHVRDCFSRYLTSVRQSEFYGVGTSSRPARGADHASRRRMERQKLASLLPKYRTETDDVEEGADPLLSNNQAKRRRKAIEMAVRNSKLREKGVRVQDEFGSRGKRAATVTVGGKRPRPSFVPPRHRAKKKSTNGRVKKKKR